MGRWQRTHEAISEAALELFTECGYDATRTAQIAARAGVSEMTLFRHFPTKDSLLVVDPFDPVMADAVRTRPGHEPPMRALVAGIGQVWAAMDPETTGALRDRLRLIAQTPTLRGAIERNSADTVSVLVGALRDRGVEEQRAHVAAAAVIAGLSAALLRWAVTAEADLDQVVLDALAVLGGD